MYSIERHAPDNGQPPISGASMDKTLGIIKSGYSMRVVINRYAPDGV